MPTATMKRLAAPRELNEPYTITLARFLVKTVLEPIYETELEIVIESIRDNAENFRAKCTLRNAGNDVWEIDMDLLLPKKDTFEQAFISSPRNLPGSPIMVTLDNDLEPGQYIYMANYAMPHQPLMFEVVTDLSAL